MHEVDEAPGRFNYTIDYDPAEVTIDAMLAAVASLGYRPNLHEAVVARASFAGLEVTARSEDDTITVDEEGNLEIEIEHELDADPAVSISVSSGSGSETFGPTDWVSGSSVSLGVGYDEAGLHEVEVVIEIDGQQVRLLVPVQVE